jgi:hypothetical protein
MLICSERSKSSRGLLSDLQVLVVQLYDGLHICLLLRPASSVLRRLACTFIKPLSG